MMRLECSALLFDLDGTLVLSAPSIEAAWHEFADRYNLDFDKIRRLLPGRRGHDILSLVMPGAPEAEIDDALAVICRREIAASETVKPLPGASTLIRALPEERWAVVTAAPRRVMVARLEGAGLPVPAVSVCAEDVHEGKPSPEGFLMAAHRLAVEPRECLGFEDSIAGLQALKRAEIKRVAVSEHKLISEEICAAHIDNYEGVAVEAGGERIGILIP